jgi:DNA-binding IclR family transcriptional regulator
MKAHPRFEEACSLAARQAMDRFDGTSAIARVMRDLSGMFFGTFALYLDALGGLTLTSLHELVAEAGLSSPGRATAMLIQLRVSGFVQRDTETTDKRVRRYVPTPELTNAMREVFRGELNALSLLEPEALLVAAHLDDKEVIYAYVRAIGKAMVDVVRLKPETEIDVFTTRNIGPLVLLHLALSGDADDTYPPKRPVPMSITDLARRFKAARSHVRRLLRDAEAEGLLTHDSDDVTGTFTEKLRQGVLRFHAGTLLGSASSALAALKQMQSKSQRPPASDAMGAYAAPSSLS